METACRIQGLTSAIFSEMDDLRREVAARGIDVINLSIGSPDRPPAEHIREALIKEISDPANYGYALTDGIPEFRRAVADWYRLRFEVELDPDREVMSLMGSQDGLGHIYLALINPGDIALIPDPGYPVYTAGLILAEGVKYPMPLLPENNFLPDLDAIPQDMAAKAKIMVLNYPNNPVAATAEPDFFAKVVNFATRYQITVVHDIAYSELAFDGYRPASFLSVPGAKEVGVEIYSLSKTYNMAGCRLGCIVGNSRVIEALRRVKSNIDFGIFRAIQKAGVVALKGPQECVRETAACYQQRRDVLVDGLNKLGWQVAKPKASMFVWCPLPYGHTDSRKFAKQLLEETGVVVTPGVAFGEKGEGFLRMALVCPEDRLAEAVARIEKKMTNLLPL